MATIKKCDHCGDAYEDITKMAYDGSLTSDKTQIRFSLDVWVLKTAILDNSKSGRLKAWAGKFNVWVPGRLQRHQKMEWNGVTGYGVTFVPEPAFGGVRVNVPEWAINVDQFWTTQMIRGGLPLATFDEIRSVLKRRRDIIQYDYTNQAWLVNGRYDACGHPSCLSRTETLRCYGTVHLGETADRCASIH